METGRAYGWEHRHKIHMYLVVVRVLFDIIQLIFLQDLMMSNNDKVWFNVGGMQFWTKWSTLRQPGCSRLSRLSLSDPEYDTQAGEFCFDRSGALFDCILDVHRTGALHFPHNICVPKILDEMAFWEIAPEKVACCCWIRIRDYCNSVKRVRTLRQALGNGTRECTVSIDTTRDSSYAGRRTENKCISALKEIRMFFAVALDKPFYSHKTKVCMAYTIGERPSNWLQK